MGLNLNLFIHGVPKGQKIWGIQEEDRFYLESFYGRKANVEVQLLVEIIQTGKKINCYYTYFRNGNIFDKDNRKGAYFALTVRSNAYYTDLNNMYNILEVAYQKMILGLILQRDASSTKFIVQDFDEVDKQLQAIEKDIVNYLGLFSVESDFIDLNGFTTNSKCEATTVNLLECNPKNLNAQVKKSGNVSVSPLHPTNEVIELTKTINEGIENIKSQSRQQIIEIQNKATQEIQTAKKEKDYAINEIKTEYSSAHKIISELENKNISLKKQLENEKRSEFTLECELGKCKKELKDYENIKKEFDSKQLKFERINEIIIDVKQALSELNLMEENKGVNKNKKHKKTSWLDKLNKFHLLINLVTTLILMIVLAFILIKGNVTPDIKNSNVRINIKEQSANDKTMELNRLYHVSIENATGGSWESDDFKIIGDEITPIKEGTCTIEYVIKGKVIKSRTVEVED